jgi:hypothetical protein
MECIEEQLTQSCMSPSSPGFTLMTYSDVGSSSCMDVCLVVRDFRESVESAESRLSIYGYVSCTKSVKRDNC